MALGHIFIVVIFIFLTLASPARGTRGLELEKKLFKNYSRNIRPAVSKDDKTLVVITLFVQHIEAVDDWKQTMKVHGALQMFWQDKRLQWNLEDYNDTDAIYVLSSRLWLPDLRLLNSVGGSTKRAFYEHRHTVLVVNSGYVSFIQDFTFLVSCALSHNRYPNDRQHCPIILASLRYDYSSVDFTYDWIDSQFVKVEQRLDWRGEKRHFAGWQLVNVTARRAYLTRQGIKYTAPTAKGAMGWGWPMVVADVEILRHKPYFHLVETTPMVMMAILTLVSFWIDAPLLTLAVLLSAIIAQGYFSWDLFAELPPATDGMPRLAIAYAFNFGMTSMAFLVHIVMHYISEQRHSTIPSLLSTFVNRVHGTPLFPSRGIRLFSSQASQGDLAKLDTEGTSGSDPPVTKKIEPRSSHFKKFALVARRVFFWAFLLTYAIFAIVIAV